MSVFKFVLKARGKLYRLPTFSLIGPTLESDTFTAFSESSLEIAIYDVNPAHRNLRIEFESMKMLSGAESSERDPRALTAKQTKIS